MPSVFPFRAVQYRQGRGDVSRDIAPPYDVLDPSSKKSLLALSTTNIVSVDLPHLPAKELGPPSSYAQAATLLSQWLSSGTLTRRQRPAMFAYRQTFQFEGRECRRTGMACTIETLPFGPRAGGGVLPHEETFSGPKEDRFALMMSTRSQLSPIFGLHPDRNGAAVRVLDQVVTSRAPDMTGTMTSDGVRHDVWTIDDDATISAYAAALAGEDVFIADGHHRYTTALNYLTKLGDIPPDHPARRCMIVLVSMSDPGLVIGPTHRVLGGMSDYSFEKFRDEIRRHFTIGHGATDVSQISAAMDDGVKNSGGRNVLGFIDAATKRWFVGVPKQADLLADRFPAKPSAWRTLDVAVVQYVIVDRICQPVLNGGNPVTWAFPHSVGDVLEILSGHESHAGGGKGFVPQVAVIVRPTPLDAVRDVSLANELMPQKSTFFYPKLATGLFMNPVE